MDETSKVEEEEVDEMSKVEGEEVDYIDEVHMIHPTKSMHR